MSSDSDRLPGLSFNVLQPGSGSGPADAALDQHDSPPVWPQTQTVLIVLPWRQQRKLAGGATAINTRF